MVPYWKSTGQGSHPIHQETGMRAIGLALADSDAAAEDEISQSRFAGKFRRPGCEAPYHLRPEAPPYARPIYLEKLRRRKPGPKKPGGRTARDVFQKA